MKPANPYREFTFGWMIFAFAIPTFGLFVFLFMTQRGDRPMTLGIFIMMTVLIMAVCLLFYGMTTTIDADRISVSFGLGLIRRRFPLSRVMSAQPVRSPWYYGWGIRFIPNGMMFNISGFDSVELRFNDSDRIFRIGTRNPQALQEAIRQRLGYQRHSRIAS
jgi:hypothetical protein